MASVDPRIDAYIAKAADFARPILLHLRAAVHAGCVDVEEAIKWSHPHFLYRRRIPCSTAALRGYVEWVVEAKRAEMRQRRIAQAMEWISEGKTRNWKCMNC